MENQMLVKDLLKDLLIHIVSKHICVLTIWLKRTKKHHISFNYIFNTMQF